MDLAGSWRAREADDELRRTGTDLDLDDSSWTALEVPGHWRAHPEFAASDGPVLYRRRFEQAPPPAGRRRWVTFEGIFYQADAWLDGAYLGDTEGYFLPHSFDITELAAMSSAHVLAVEVTCSPERGTSGRRNITGMLQHSEAVDRDWNPGGLWRTVRVHDTGPVRIDRLRVLCRDADETRAHLRLHARLDALASDTVRIRTSADGEVVGETEHTVAAGSNDIEWSLDIAAPRLWWPHRLGAQPLTDLSVEVVIDGEVSDCTARRTGLREVAFNNWVFSINGERLFLKGANLVPARPGLGDAGPGLVRGDVERAVEAGLDALRVQAHIATDELYAAADELGVVLLQDFPLQWSYGHHIRREAVSQAREAVSALGHHPSIIQWCAHDEPIADAPQLDGDSTRTRLRRFVRQQLPTWNKSVLDRWVKRSFEQTDPTRPTIAHSGVLPHLPQLDGTDSHLWLGWHRGSTAELAEHARSLPRLVRFVSEFGAQSVPDSAAEFVDVATWPALDWEYLAEHHGLEAAVMQARHPPELYPSFAAWARATQRYQAELLRQHIETLRRLKYRPTGGFCFSWLADAMPMISASVLDHERKPKAAWTAVVEACRPVIVVCDALPESVQPGRSLAIDVHVVSDLRESLTATVAVSTAWPGGTKRWGFAGEIEPDDCVRVGRVTIDVPDGTEGGQLLVSLDLEGHTASGHPVTAARRAEAPIAAG